MTPSSRFTALASLLACQLIWSAPAARASDVHASQHVSADTVTVVGSWEMAGLEPSRSGFMFARMEVTETLLDVDDDGRLSAALATSWHASADGLQWRFPLRTGSRFHDGSPVTAPAVAAALTRAMAVPGVLKLADIRTIGADQDAVVVTLGSPFAPLPFLFTHATTLILAPSAFDANGRVHSIIGSGPFKMTSISMPQQFSVERFDDWHGWNSKKGNGAQPIRLARYISVSRAETRALMAQSGQAHLAFALDPPSVKRLQTNTDLTMLSTRLPRTTFIKLNAGHPFLRDQRVRLAISLGIERSNIAAALLRDKTLGATQLFPPAMPLWHSNALAPLHTDLGAARRLLQQAGWTAGSDGMLQQAGQRFELKLLTFVDRPELTLVATAIQEQLRQIGIRVRVVVGNSSDIPAGHRSGTLEMALAARNFGTLANPVPTLLQDYGPDGGDWGAMHWHDEALIAALKRLVHEDDSDVAQRDRTTVARQLQQGLPVIPVLWYRQALAVSPRLSGASIDPFERSYRLSDMAWRPR
jgi:peptide/nickel transport system substrate-binding protein